VRNLLILLARLARFERATAWFVVRRTMYIYQPLALTDSYRKPESSPISINNLRHIMTASPTETFADLDACKVRAAIVLDNRGGPGSMRYILTNCEDNNDE